MNNIFILFCFCILTKWIKVDTKKIIQIHTHACTKSNSKNYKTTKKRQQHKNIINMYTYRHRESFRYTFKLKDHMMISHWQYIYWSIVHRLHGIHTFIPWSLWFFNCNISRLCLYDTLKRLEFNYDKWICWKLSSKFNGNWKILENKGIFSMEMTLVMQLRFQYLKYDIKWVYNIICFVRFLYFDRIWKKIMKKKRTK